jgi:hypothetical protein
MMMMSADIVEASPSIVVRHDTTFVTIENINMGFFAEKMIVK